MNLLWGFPAILDTCTCHFINIIQYTHTAPLSIEFFLQLSLANRNNCYEISSYPLYRLQTFPKIPDYCRALQWWNLRVTITFIISFNIYNMIFKDLFQHPCVSIHQTMHIYVVITSIIYFQFNNGRIWLDVLFHESTHWILNIGCVWDIRFWLTAWTVLNKLVGLCFRNVSLCLKIVTYNIYHSPKYIIHYIKYG